MIESITDANKYVWCYAESSMVRGLNNFFIPGYRAQGRVVALNTLPATLLV